MLPEVEGRHRVSVVDRRPVDKNAALVDENATGSGDSPAGVDQAATGFNQNATGSSTNATGVEPNTANQQQASAAVASASIDAIIPQSIRDFDEALTLSRLRELVEQSRQQVTATAEAEGRAQGYSAGQAAAAEELATLRNQVTQLSEQLNGLLSAEQQRLQAALQATVVQIAKVYCRERLAVDAGLIGQIVQSALAEMSPAGVRPRLSLAPASYQLLEQAQMLDPACDWQSDPALSAGGCKVVTPYSDIDYSLELQIEQIATELFSRAPAQPTPDAVDELVDGLVDLPAAGATPASTQGGDKNNDKPSDEDKDPFKNNGDAGRDEQ